MILCYFVLRCVWYCSSLYVCVCAALVSGVGVIVVCLHCIYCCVLILC